MKKTIYTKEKISESVQSLLKKYHAEKAILFGSYARGEATEESDIDLIIRCWISESRYENTSAA